MSGFGDSETVVVVLVFGGNLDDRDGGGRGFLDLDLRVVLRYRQLVH